MMSDKNRHWTDRLSDYLESSLSDEERGALEAHLAVCPECTAALAEIEEVILRAHALGEVAPERDLWPGIERALGKPDRPGVGVIPLPTPEARGRPTRAGVYLSRRQLAAAAVAVALLSSTATWALGRNRGPRPAAEPVLGPAMMTATSDGPPAALADELSHLEAELSSAQKRLDPATVRILERNLDVIDRAIQDSRRALATDPGDPFLRQHLQEVYRQKADYLREATSIAGWAG